MQFVKYFNKNNCFYFLIFEISIFESKSSRKFQSVKACNKKKTKEGIKKQTNNTTTTTTLNNRKDNYYCKQK